MRSVVSRELILSLHQRTNSQLHTVSHQTNTAAPKPEITLLISRHHFPSLSLQYPLPPESTYITPASVSPVLLLPIVLHQQQQMQYLHPQDQSSSHSSLAGRYLQYFPHLSLFYSTDSRTQAQAHFQLKNYAQAWAHFRDFLIENSPNSSTNATASSSHHRPEDSSSTSQHHHITTIASWKDIWMCMESLVRIANFDEALNRFASLEMDHYQQESAFKAEFCLWRARAYLAIHNTEKALENLLLALEIDKWNVNIWQVLAQEQLLTDQDLEGVYKKYWGNCLLEEEDEEVSSRSSNVATSSSSNSRRDANTLTPQNHARRHQISINTFMTSPKTPMQQDPTKDDDAMHLDDTTEKHQTASEAESKSHQHSSASSAEHDSTSLENETIVGLNIGLLILKDQASILQKLEREYNDVFQSEHVQWKLAKWLLKQEKYEQAYSIAVKFLALNSESVAKLVSMNRERVIVYLTCLVQLHKKDELYYFGHNLVEKHGHLCESWYSVGCYYYAIENFTQAEKYFKKSVGMDEGFLDAWMALGHVLSYKDDSEQALQAYRSAHRLFPGVHQCVLCIGMEYAKTNNLLLAEKFVLQARDMCESTDVLVHNELGVIKFKLQQYSESLHHFLYALSLKPSTQITTPDQWSSIHYNLGHCYRKLHRFEEAIHHYTEALSLNPNDGSIYCSIGFTHHLSGKLDKAIGYYHHALGMQFEEQHFASELLSRALKSMSEMETDELVEE